MQSWKLSIFVNAYRIRLDSGELLEEIDASYPKLTLEEKKEIREKLGS